MRHFDENSDSEAASILSPWIVRKIACLSDDTDEEFSARIKKSKSKPTVPHVSSRGMLSDNILSSYLNKAINLLSSESDAEYVSLRRKKFLPKSQSNFDKRPKVPMVSAKTKVSEHILNVKMDKEIDSLSSESDSEEEYTIEKGVRRTVKMLKPGYQLIDPMTNEDFVRKIQFRDVTAYFVDLMPDSLKLVARSIRSVYSKVLWKSRKSGLISLCTTVCNMTSGVFAIVFHLVYLCSFAWQIIVNFIQVTVVYSDNFWTSVLNDRLSPKEQIDQFEEQSKSSVSNSDQSLDAYDVRVSHILGSRRKKSTVKKQLSFGNVTKTSYSTEKRHSTSNGSSKSLSDFVEPIAES